MYITIVLPLPVLKRQPVKFSVMPAYTQRERMTVWGGAMKRDIEKRAAELAEYIIETGGTVRNAAARFGVSKSTAHKDLTERLARVDGELWRQAKSVLEKNKAERHIRGGEATRVKYKGKIE